MRKLALALGLSLAACHSPPPAMMPPPCTFVCAAPSFSRLDRLAGQPGGAGWVDAIGADAHFADPWSMATDGNGRLFLADGEMIRAIDLASVSVTTLAGSFAGVGGTDGVGTQATFNTPSGLAYFMGALYVTDTENHTLRKIDPATGTVTTIAGAYGVPGTTDDLGLAARFREPEGLAVDAGGNLYIADVDNNTIRKMVIATGAVTTVAGTAGTSGTTDGTGAAARFSKPKELTIDGTSLYIVDSLNDSVRKMDTTTFDVSTVATFTTPAQGVAVDGTDLLVTLGDYTIVRVAIGSGMVTPLSGASGMQGFVDGALADARFNQPTGLFLDGAGDLLVADNGNHVLRKIALASGTVSTLAGAKSSGSADGAGAAARFFAPQGFAADATTLYVADTANQTIRKVELASGQVTTLAGAVGQAGTAGGALADARFNQPEGLALDVAKQILYVADSNNRSIRRIDLTAGMVTTLSYNRAPGDPFTALSVPSGLALSGGKLYISDYGNHDVVALDPDAQVISTLAGKEGVPGPVDGVGGKARFYGPQGIAADEAGHLYVADNLNDTIREIEIASGTVSTVAGQAQTTGDDDGVGGAARFSFPVGVAVDGAGELFVADSLGDTIRHVDLKSGAVTTLLGVPQLPGVKLGPLPAQLSQPAAIALTPAGGLVIASENSVLLAH